LPACLAEVMACRLLVSRQTCQFRRGLFEASSAKGQVGRLLGVYAELASKDSSTRAKDADESNSPRLFKILFSLLPSSVAVFVDMT
jgi:hypothetical protein